MSSKTSSKALYSRWLSSFNRRTKQLGLEFGESPAVQKQEQGQSTEANPSTTHDTDDTGGSSGTSEMPDDIGYNILEMTQSQEERYAGLDALINEIVACPVSVSISAEEEELRWERLPRNVQRYLSDLGNNGLAPGSYRVATTCGSQMWVQPDREAVDWNTVDWNAPARRQPIGRSATSTTVPVQGPRCHSGAADPAHTSICSEPGPDPYSVAADLAPINSKSVPHYLVERTLQRRKERESKRRLKRMGLRIIRVSTFKVRVPDDNSNGAGITKATRRTLQRSSSWKRILGRLYYRRDSAVCMSKESTRAGILAAADVVEWDDRIGPKNERWEDLGVTDLGTPTAPEIATGSRNRWLWWRKL
ncbi:hypothetical protein BX600DRAFT_507636 [Xylariales sp. PMI_506]|nr:hypothetical protein BX600DRAFT_507636 [Xylariales sp. PMI_506]